MRAFGAFPILVFSLSLWSGGGAARAGDAVDPDLPTIDPTGPLRIIDQDGSETTSDCIGYPRTPLCAAETHMACRARGNQELCDIALGRSPGPPGPFSPSPNNIIVDGYRLRGAHRLTREGIPPGNEERPHPWRPGDIALTFEKRNCTYRDAAGQCEPRRLNSDMSYVVRKGAYGWRVIAWDNRWDFTRCPPPWAKDWKN